MKMTVDEALKTLAIESGYATKDVIKKNYRRLASKYHPDKNHGNPGAKDAMQRINIARDLLYDMPNDFNPNSTHGHGPSVIDLGGVTVIKRHGRTIVSGNTFPFRRALKKYRFKWNPYEKFWWYDGLYPIEDCLNEF